MSGWLEPAAEGCVIRVRAVPRASRSSVAGPAGDSLRVRVQAPPVEGKANKALLAFLAQRLGVPPRRLALLSGRTGRDKRVLVQGLDAAAVRRALDAE